MSEFRVGCFVILFTIALCLRPFPLAAEEALFLTPIPVQQGSSSDFVVYQSVPVDSKEAGMTGFLQILQDKRVTSEYRQTWGSSAGPEMALEPDDPLVKSFEAHPLKNGRIRLVGQDGHVVSVSSFGEPLVKVDTDYLYGTDFPTYLVSVDYGVGMGSYAGPATTFMEVRGGRLIDLPILVGQSLKNGWQIVPASGAVGKEIEQVQCHPNFKNPNWANTDEFVVDYSTYRFVNGQWRKKSVEKIGFWEADDGWPPRSSFP